MMSIRFQLIAATLVVSVVAVAVFLPFARARVDQGFDAFEVEYVARNHARLARVLEDHAAHIGRTASDYGAWDSTAEFLAGARPQWPARVLTDSLLANFGVDSVVVGNTRLEPMAAHTGGGELPAAVAGELLRGGGLCGAAMRTRKAGWRFAWIEGQPQIVACAPVLPSDYDPEVPASGAMAWAAHIDAATIEDLSGLLQFGFELHPSRELPADAYESDRIVTWMPVRNSDQSVDLVASLQLARPLGPQRDLTIQAMLLLMAAAICIPALLMLAFFEVAIVRPLQRVSQWVRGMRHGEASEAPPPVPGRAGFSELGQLVHDFAQTQAKVRQMNRVYAVLSDINGLIVRATDRDELFQQACRILVETGKFSKAWIGVIDPDTPPIRILAWAGASDDYFADLQRRLAANTASSKAGVLTRTLQEGAPVLCNDVANDPSVLEREKLLNSGSLSFALFPLTIDGHMVGVLSIHAPVTGFFDKEETDLLLGLANDIAFALDHLMKADRIAHLANHDVLTGLPNRSFFAALLAQEFGDAARDGEPFCVALLDLVRFRRINETLGRRAGDELLMQVAARLREWDASAARLTVDVFALRVGGRHTAGEFVHEFEQLVAHCFDRPFVVGGEEVRMGCRIGAAVFPGDGDDPETLLRNAESALRKARTSIEPFVFYEPDMNTCVSEALLMESRLRKAIEREEFVLHYQPKFRLADRRICGVEALIRWRDPEHGLIPPGRFIPTLEETGLIGAAGRWALRRALEEAQRWKQRSGRTLRVAVNVSPLQLNQPNFIEQVAELIAPYGGDTLELEITESVIMDDVDRKIGMIEELRKLDVTVAVDDFGTGYSSLAYISRLPITSLKIDRAFINRMDEEPQRYSLVSSIVALARPLELKVVAEGVETEAQARLLTLLRCDEAQGFLFSKPVDAERFLELLLAEPPGDTCNAPHGAGHLHGLART